MASRAFASFATALVAAGIFLLPASDIAQAQGDGSAGKLTVEQEHIPTHLLVYVREANGGPVNSLVLVTVTRMANQYWQQKTAEGGQAYFENLGSGRYSVQVVAGGYEKAVEDIHIVGGGGRETVEVMLRPESAGGTSAPVVPGPPVLAPKAQKELGKALEALRTGNLAEGRKRLDAVYRLAPSHPDVNFLFGVYSSQINDWSQAMSYWEKAISLYPQHLPAQISLGDAFLRENKPVDAVSHLKKALEVDPNSWRAHAFLADANLRLGSSAEAVSEAERAIALGQERASGVRPILARALAEQGKRDQALKTLESYLREHPTDVGAQKELSSLRTPVAAAISSAPAATPDLVTLPTILPPGVAALPLPSNWLPPDIDERVPPVEAGVPCALNDVVQNAGKRVEEFMHNVDHFTATESLFHESVNDWGFPAPAETRKFEYVVSIEEIRPGILNVSEYRDGAMSYEKFPAGVATLGLPSLVLIFHPFNAVNYDMSCEGLAHWNGGLAWQVHFRQRPDRPARDRRFRLGRSGSAYTVGLKGRAWIAADTFQIVRLETDLVAPLPEIRLFADRTAIEYSAVHFRKQNVDMWLPQSAEVFSDVRGRRFHRRHSFSDYLLFSVDDRQRISVPKIEEAPDTKSASGPAKSSSQ
jgi:tetratricopeptide (TPR) repeat protein